MALIVKVQLGTVGSSVTRVKLQSCNSGCAVCTDLAGYTDVPVSSFQPSGLVISTVPDNTTSIKVIALDAACPTTSQCLSIISVEPTTTTSTTTTTTTSASTTTTTTSTTTTTTTIPVISYCMGYSLEDCCAAKSDYDTNCAGPPP